MAKLIHGWQQMPGFVEGLLLLSAKWVHHDMRDTRSRCQCPCDFPCSHGYHVAGILFLAVLEFLCHKQPDLDLDLRNPLRPDDKAISSHT